MEKTSNGRIVTAKVINSRIGYQKLEIIYMGKEYEHPNIGVSTVNSQTNLRLELRLYPSSYELGRHGHLVPKYNLALAKTSSLFLDYHLCI